MKAIKIFSLLAIIILLASCSANDDGDNNFANATSQQGCLNVSGPTAVYWDYAHSIPAPFNRIPIIQNPQGRFNHPAVFTNLNVSVPQGYTATAITVPNLTYGVDLRRRTNNQTSVLWRYIPLATVSNNTTTASLRAAVINDLMANEYGFNGTPTVECAPQDQVVNLGGGFERRFSSRSITFNGIRAIVWIAITTTGINASFKSAVISISSGPINEYNNLALEVFFPLSFELLITDKETLSDRDNDGTPDVFDSEPDNPNVQ